MRMAAMLAAALLLGGCAAQAPPAEGEAFSLRPFTAAGTLAWQREEYTASLCCGADGILTVSLQNARFAEPVVLFAGEQAQGMRLGALSLELPLRGGPPKNAAAKLRGALISLEGVRLCGGVWQGEGCALSAQAGVWKTLTLPEGTLVFSSVSFGGER